MLVLGITTGGAAHGLARVAQMVIYPKGARSVSEATLMKVLALSSARREPDISCVYEELGRFVDLDLKLLSKDEQRNLKQFFRGLDLAKYDRVLIDLHFKTSPSRLTSFARFQGYCYMKRTPVRTIWIAPLEGRFSRFYRSLPNARMIVTGAGTAEKLKAEGFNANFIPKGYDPRMVRSEVVERDIELGFIGRTASAAYAGRKALLDQLVEHEPVQLLRTEPGRPYWEMLNRIKFFISADVGLGEYMAKNFEAMASGCVLFAWRQGIEERAIGLRDGIDLVLYSDVEELRTRLADLRSDSKQALSISESGRRFVKEHLSHVRLARHMFAVINEPWPSFQPPSLWRMLRERLSSNVSRFR